LFFNDYEQYLKDILNINIRIYYYIKKIFIKENIKSLYLETNKTNTNLYYDILHLLTFKMPILNVIFKIIMIYNF